MFSKKKFLISHRGNINGSNKENENSYETINLALKKGFEVEIDVRSFKNKLYIGHDEPNLELNFNKIEDVSKIWFHCKDIDSIAIIKQINCKKFFFHQQDDLTLTSNGYFWTFPGQKITKNSIIVLPENANYKTDDFKMCSGICSDFIINYKND